MLMTRVNTLLQMSRSIFVYGEITKINKIHRSNYIVWNYHVMETVKRTISNRKTLQFIEAVNHNKWDGCTWWFFHRSSICRMIQDNAGRRSLSNFFKVDRFLDLISGVVLKKRCGNVPTPLHLWFGLKPNSNTKYCSDALTRKKLF